MGSVFQLFAELLRWSKSVRHSRPIIVLATVAGVIAGIGSTVLIATINSALTGDQTSRTSLIWWVVALCIIIPVSGFLSQALLVALTAKSAHDLRLQLSRQILAAPYRLLEELGAHRLLATITDDIPAVTTAMTSLPLLFTQAAIMVGCLVYLGLLSWPLLLIMLGYMLIGIITYQLPLVKAVHYFRLMREEWDAMFKAVRALTDGTKELKLHRLRRQAFMAKEMKPAVDKIERYGIVGNALSVAAANWGQILFFIFIGLVLFATPFVLSVDQATITGYVLTILFMISPLSVILNITPNLGRAHIAAGKIKQLGLSLSSAPAESTALWEEPDAGWHALELRSVTHSYRHDGEGDNFTLGPLDLTFHPGELVFVIGGNGSGKTTLAKLLMGLYEPDAGEIRFDGKVVNLDNRDDYRQQFSVVFYDFYLFEQLYGLDRQKLESRGRDYLQQLQLSHKVEIKDGKLSTLDLSQGQRKRLALLTAYLEDRPIYIFDEWASDQDPQFREIFYYQILPELKARGKTVVVITHDDRYYALADRLIKLERGQLVYDKRLPVAVEAVDDVSAPLA
jgi:putative pyoverdin transport system ATP-binding/permease protein